MFDYFGHGSRALYAIKCLKANIMSNGGLSSDLKGHRQSYYMSVLFAIGLNVAYLNRSSSSKNPFRRSWLLGSFSCQRQTISLLARLHKNYPTRVHQAGWRAKSSAGLHNMANRQRPLAIVLVEDWAFHLSEASESTPDWNTWWGLTVKPIEKHTLKSIPRVAVTVQWAEALGGTMWLNTGRKVLVSHVSGPYVHFLHMWWFQLLYGKRAGASRVTHMYL